MTTARPGSADDLDRMASQLSNLALDAASYYRNSKAVERGALGMMFLVAAGLLLYVALKKKR